MFSKIDPKIFKTNKQCYTLVKHLIVSDIENAKTFNIHIQENITDS